MQTTNKMASLPDLRDFASVSMSERLFKELDDASGDQITKKRNEDDFVKIKLKLRGMANMKHFKGTETTILGHKVAYPFGLSALPYQGRYHFDGEIGSAVAAKAMGVVFTLNAAHSSHPLKDVLSESEGGIKLLRLCPYMSAEARGQALALAAAEKDIIGIVLDFSVSAKIDSQTKTLNAKIPKAQWKLSEIKEFKAATKKPVIV
jgi:(S)-2-hydroxy-acid oxidase